MAQQTTTENKVDRITSLLGRARHHRTLLDEITRDFVDLHGYEMSSAEATELRFVIVDGHDYEATIKHIMNMKCQQIAAEEREAELQSEFLD